MVRIFISHSHSDQAIAFKLVNFLLASLRIEEEDILCTSNPDAETETKLQQEKEELNRNYQTQIEELQQSHQNQQQLE